MVTYSKVFSTDWVRIKICDVLDFKNGLNKGKEFFGVGTPIVNYMDVYKNRCLTNENIKGMVSLSADEIKRYEARINDVFFTRTSETPEEVGISSVLLESINNCVFSGFILRGRPKNELITPLYCQFCFSTKKVRDDVVKNCTYTTRALTNGKQLSEIELFIPAETAEQEAIASVLSDFDEHIENLTELIEKKKAIRDGALEDLVSGKTRLHGFNSKTREYKPIKSVYRRVKGTPITASTMSSINVSTGAIRVFAGGTTECRTNIENLPNANIIRKPVVIVQSRGVIDFVYCDEPCTFKNEMWGYTSHSVASVRFLFYYLKHNVEYFRNEGSGRSSFSQISLPVTEEYLIPIISAEEQEEIVQVLTAMDEELEALEEEKSKLMQIREGAMDDLLTGRVRLKV